MVQSTSSSSGCGLHVAIIMDGNGRWATSRGLSRSEGHRAGTEAVDRTVASALDLGIEKLTLFAFSADNWERPPHEVASLLRNFEDYFRRKTYTWAAEGIRASATGRRDRLPASLLEAVEAAEAATAAGRAMRLRIAMDYSGRDSILQAARLVGEPASVTRENFSRLLAEATHAGAPPTDVDLLIRTGGEQRLSDLPLWEIAYAELYFTRRMWPDFGAADLEEALREYHARERRFGRVVEAAAV